MKLFHYRRPPVRGTTFVKRPMFSAMIIDLSRSNSRPVVGIRRRRRAAVYVCGHCRPAAVMKYQLIFQHFGRATRCWTSENASMSRKHASRFHRSPTPAPRRRTEFSSAQHVLLFYASVALQQNIKTTRCTVGACVHVRAYVRACVCVWYTTM